MPDFECSCHRFAFDRAFAGAPNRPKKMEFDAAPIAQNAAARASGRVWNQSSQGTDESRRGLCIPDEALRPFSAKG
jgi:hypothetical protein